MGRKFLFKGGKSMKVLYCGMDENLGGIESFVVNMYRRFDKSKIQVDFLKITDTIYYEEEFVDNGSIVYKIPSRKSNPALFYYELLCFFRKHKEYQIVHHHLNSCSSIDPLIIAKLFNRKTIAHSHNEYKGNKFISRMLHNINKHLLPYFCDVNIACSNAAGKSIFKDKSFTIVNNGIDIQKYIFDEKVRENYREKLGLTGKFVVGHIGRFKYQKNHDFLIDIFKEVHQKNPNSVLLLIGEGPMQLEVERKVKVLNLSDSVIFLGVRTDIPELLQAMDIFVLPSRYEGLGIVLIEAQAAGLHSIIADSIPNDAFVTNLIEAVMLKKSPEVWAQQILKYSDEYHRSNPHEEIKAAGFDSSTSSKILEEIYLEN